MGRAASLKAEAYNALDMRPFPRLSAWRKKANMYPNTDRG